jgi:hypothetical protein
MDGNYTEKTEAHDPEVPPVVVAPINVKVTGSSPAKKVAADPPLFSFQVSNPITYIKAWWKKLVGNEGIKLTLQIKPLTAVTLMLVFSGVGFGFGRLAIPEPLVQFIPVLPSPTPIPTPDPWKETAFTGKLQFASPRYYLTTSSDEAITLEVPATINLKPLIGRRILVIGRYNKDTKIMIVTGTPDLEILSSNPQPIPTIKPTSSPSPSPNTETIPSPIAPREALAE